MTDPSSIVSRCLVSFVRRSYQLMKKWLMLVTVTSYDCTTSRRLFLDILTSGRKTTIACKLCLTTSCHPIDPATATIVVRCNSIVNILQLLLSEIGKQSFRRVVNRIRSDIGGILLGGLCPVSQKFDVHNKTTQHVGLLCTPAKRNNNHLPGRWDILINSILLAAGKNENIWLKMSSIGITSSCIHRQTPWPVTE